MGRRPIATPSLAAKKFARRDRRQAPLTPEPVLTFLQSDKNAAAVLAPFTDDVEALIGLIRTYSVGQCAVFASRVHELTGWQVVGLCDVGGDRPMYIHFANRRPDGGLVDARGRYPYRLDTFIHIFHGVANAQWRDLTAFELDDEMRQEVDVLLNASWGIALVLPSERLAAGAPASP